LSPLNAAIDSLGPFDVIVQKDKENNHSSPIDPLAVGRLLYTTNKNDILEIKKVGFSKINIRLKSREAANGLISNCILKEKKYLVYVPFYRTTRKGIIRGVPLDVADDEILRGLDSKIKILSVQRLSRRRRDLLSPPHSNVNINVDSNVNITNHNNLTPSRTILVTFGGQTLPDYIYLFMLKYSVLPFISRTSLCFSCYRFGHIGAHCKGRARCIDCGGDRHEDGVLCPKKGCEPTCINCGGSHKASNYNCPEYIAQRRTREISAHENIPLSEAASRVRGRAGTPHERFSSRYGEFPRLPSTSSTSRERSGPPPPAYLYSQVLSSPSSSPPFELGSSSASNPVSFSQSSHPSDYITSLSGAFPGSRHSVPLTQFKSNDVNNNSSCKPSYQDSRPKGLGPVAGPYPRPVPPSTPPLLYPNGRVPSSPSGNGVALGAGSDPPPPSLLSFILTALGLEPLQLKQLLQIFFGIIEKLEPFLRLLGLHDFICKISNQLAAAFDVTSSSNTYA